MEPLTETEKSLVNQLRSRVSDLNLELKPNERYKSDMFYVRWIRARDQNLNQAESMLRQSMEWRKSFDMDNVNDWNPPELLLTKVDIMFLGYSRNNCPTFYIPLRTCDFKGICDLQLKQECIKYFMRMFDSAVEMTTGGGRNGETSKGQVIMFVDFQDYSLTNVLYPSVADMSYQLAKTLEANFPENMYKFIAINAGRAFQITEKIVRPITSQRTRDKNEVHTEPIFQLLDRIHELFPEEELPPFLGGSDRHFEQELLAKHPTFAKLRREALLENEALLQAGTATVLAGDQLFLEIDIQLPRSKLQYSVSVDNHDIDFMIFKGAKVFVAKKRIGPKEASGDIECEEPGLFIVRFDNLYSKYRTKQVRFTINTIEPIIE